MTTTSARVHRAAVAAGGGTVIPKAIREPPRHAGRRNADRRVRAAAPARMTTTMTADARRAPALRRAAVTRTTMTGATARAGAAVAAGSAIPKVMRAPPRHAGRNVDRRGRVRGPAMMTTMTADVRRAPARRRAAATRTTMIGETARAAVATAAGTAILKVTREPPRHAGRKKTDRRVRVRAAAMMTTTMTADVRRASAPRRAAATRMTMIGATARAGAGTVAGTAILKVTREPPRHAGRRNADHRVRAAAPAIIK
jgi:hypothetical protein